jgi:hypothetical protein
MPNGFKNPIRQKGLETLAAEVFGVAVAMSAFGGNADIPFRGRQDRF